MKDIRLLNPCMDCPQKYYCDKPCWKIEVYIGKLEEQERLEKVIECRYRSGGGTYCFHYDKEIVDDLGNNECDSCEMNNNCEYCDWRRVHQENCTNCNLSEVENE